MSRTGFSLTKALDKLGIHKPRFYEWKRRLNQPNHHNATIPKSTWLMPEEKTAIIEYFKKNPLNGCKRLSYMMTDEDIAYVSPSSVQRVLKEQGLIDQKDKSPSSLKGTGFKQPNNPHEHWHIDISYINAGGTFYYLYSILDGYSRFIVDWELKASMKEPDIEMLIQKAIEKTGTSKTRVISDNGPQFKAKDFKSFIKLSGMEHVFTSPYYPQSNGKIERWHKELKKSKIRPCSPSSFEEAKAMIGDFIEEYNYKRLHGAIGYVTPYDKLLNIDEQLQKERKTKHENIRTVREKYWEKSKSFPNEQNHLAS